MWGRFFKYCAPNLTTLYITALLVLTVGSVCGQDAEQRKLVYVTVLFRHGDRSPLKPYPNDTNKEEDWPQGYGQLSREGMQQHYKLGQFLRKRYTGFLNESYNRHEILVLSTDRDRTLMSAQSNLAGLYPPKDEQVFTPDLKWQPIPVHTVAQNEERLLTFPQRDCPRYQQLMKETEQTDEFKKVALKYKDVIELVKNKTRLKNINVETVWTVYDTLFCESQHKKPTPAWATVDVMEKLKELNDFALQVMFGFYKQQEKSRLQGGILLGEIVKNLSKMAVPKPNQKLKLMMLSAHDTTVAALQASLNVFNGRQPPYASCQIIELYREANGSYSVSLFYQKEFEPYSMSMSYQKITLRDPYPQKLPNCSLNCPLDEFVEITKSSISTDWDKECQRVLPRTCRPLPQNCLAICWHK